MDCDDGSTWSGKWCPSVARLDCWADYDWSNGLQIESAEELIPIYVRTRNTLYEIVVLASRTREILVRGGRFFPECTRAVLAGSSLGGTFLKIGGIYVGFRMELHCWPERIVTSPVISVGLMSGIRPAADICAPSPARH
jgi:hypothetical protein